MNIKRVLGKYPEGRFYPLQKPSPLPIVKGNGDYGRIGCAFEAVLKGATLGAIVGATSGAVAGAFLGGPIGSGLGAVAGGTVAAIIGYSIVFEKCAGGW